MFLDVNKYVHTLCTMNITANQYLLCYLLYTDQKKEGKFIRKGSEIANLYKYASANKGKIAWTKEEVRDLVDKGFLIDPAYTDKSTYPDHLIVTEKFTENLFIRANKFEEFWEAYPFIVPNFTNPRGPSIKLKVCDKDDVKKLYLRKVKTIAQHKEILDILEWAVENEKLNVNIKNFIASEQWKAFKQEREQNEGTGNVHIAK